ncbi:hypothetical protein F4679DRAFT_473753 [Xylaria curta]|nr:hypothetical protein F4679DRAFT_473753 [Xylaria curta]
MPRKVRPPPDTAQNRENQQRSRARRREYLASLEARVKEFESREVQATLAMQRAAQEVAWVNERLMELLTTKGVTREEVDEFLRRARSARDVDQGLGVHFGARACRGVESNQGRNIADTEMDMSTATDEPKPSADEGQSAHVTSCDDAASIIADFQGHGDVSHVRRVLGCGDAAKCHVKNTRLFQIMDEAGCP